tara:strand:+ start:2418 stop:2888 length:471 start_codon:yes stop_codon:yes gene_type:complete
MDKNIFFYSLHNPSCQQILRILNEERIGTDLLRVCIDTTNVRIPSFITSVPSIYLTRSRKVLTDHNLAKWLTILREKKESKKLAPYCMENNAFTGSFTFLNGEDQVPNFNFSCIESPDVQMNTPAMTAPQDKKGVLKNYEALLQQRGELDRSIQRI